MDFGKVAMIVTTIIQIVSFCFTIYIFFRFAQRASPLRRLQNHVLMCLMIVATWTISIELPHTQKYLWTGSVSIYTSWFCSLWNASFFITATLNRILMAFMCVERHFLVFRPRAYHTRRSRLLFHYIPLIFIISTILIYLFVTNIFISCPQMSFNYSLFMCGYTCWILIDNIATVYAWVFVFIPRVITIIGCVLLPIRFIIQKRQLQRVQWHRARKMIIQTSVIASIYTLCWLPYTVIAQILINNPLFFSNPDINRFLTILPYMTSLLTPLIVFHTIQQRRNPGIMEQIKHRFCPQRQRAVQPTNNVVARQINHHIN